MLANLRRANTDLPLCGNPDGRQSQIDMLIIPETDPNVSVHIRDLQRWQTFTSNLRANLASHNRNTVNVSVGWDPAPPFIRGAIACRKRAQSHRTAEAMGGLGPAWTAGRASTWTGLKRR